MIEFNWRLGCGKRGGELGGDDHLIAILALGHPLSDPRFALFVLVVVGRVDEVAAVLIEEIEHLKGSLLVAFAQELLPGLAEVHGPQA